MIGMDYRTYGRFMNYVEIRDLFDCWLWTGAQANSYGVLNVKGNKYVHRLMWEHHNGEIIAPGNEIDHTCETRLCVNPQHLESVTKLENLRRSREPR